MKDNNYVTLCVAGCLVILLGVFAYYYSISLEADQTLDNAPANSVADDSPTSTEHKVMKPVMKSKESSTENETDDQEKAAEEKDQTEEEADQKTEQDPTEESNPEGGGSQ